MPPPVHTIVVALIRRGESLLLVEAQGPDDPAPVWMLPGAKVEDGESVIDALRRELSEETGLELVGEPQLAFEVEVDLQTDAASGLYRALTFACEASGVVRPNDPDALVRAAEWVDAADALVRLSRLEWYECEPLRRYLSGEAGIGIGYRYRVTGVRGGMVLEALELTDTNR